MLVEYLSDTRPLRLRRQAASAWSSSPSPAGPTVLYARTDRTGTPTFPRVQEGRWLLQIHGGPDYGSLISTEIAVSAIGEVVVELALQAPVP